MSRINGFLTAMRGRQDLALVAILITSITVMILPLPAIALDFLIALNISLTVLILIVAVYLDRPTSFSTFPAIILIATTFRLAISISTTRSILTEAEGGSIIETFGRFVTGGNLVVGLVIFLIITIVQFVVITKGAERIAEVAARFVLDALPGRQMSIDAELRSGDIDHEEARRRRRHLDKENQFFGAMDGAMKFVKGDAIAGLLIIVVNLIGGIAIGATQHDMSLSEATQTFSLLTIGDGLVAQIPALLLALCAGAVVTRVASEDKNDLGHDIATELGNSGRTMILAGGIVALLGLVPGFPTLFFAGLGGLLIWVGTVRVRQDRTRAAAERQRALPPEAIETDSSASETGERLVVRLGTALAGRLDGLDFTRARAAALAEHQRERGLDAPRFGILVDPGLPPDDMVVDLDGVPLGTARLPADRLIACGATDMLTLAGADPIPAIGWPIAGAHLVAAADQAKLDAAGIEVPSVGQLVVRAVMHHVRRQSGALLGFDRVQAMLRSVQQAEPQLAEQVIASVPMGRLLDVVRRLADEEVALVPHRTVFESLAEWGPREDDPGALAEHVRRAMRRRICHGLADRQRVIAAYVVEPDLEQALRDGLRVAGVGTVLSPSGQVAGALLAQIERIREPADPSVPRPVIAVAGDLRRHLRAWLDTHGVRHPVIAFPEVAAEFSLQPIGTLALAAGGGLRAA